jgi:predicted membrane chloride channel (bestrophin family)
MLERQKQQKQAKAAAPAQGDGKNLQNLFSAWGFSSSGEIDIDNSQQPSWASMEETPSLREIQEQEAVQREMAQMDEQQRKRQQQQQQAQQKAASDMAWTGGRGTKKPTLAEIQAEELKQQQKRQKEMQQQHKQQLKAQREQLSRFSSPWAGGAQVVRVPFPFACPCGVHT